MGIIGTMVVSFIILKKKVNSVNYMPIELLSKENISFYCRKNIG